MPELWRPPLPLEPVDPFTHPATWASVIAAIVGIAGLAASLWCWVVAHRLESREPLLRPRASLLAFVGPTVLVAAGVVAQLNLTA